MNLYCLLFESFSPCVDGVDFLDLTELSNTSEIVVTRACSMLLSVWPVDIIMWMILILLKIYKYQDVFSGQEIHYYIRKKNWIIKIKIWDWR